MISSSVSHVTSDADIHSTMLMMDRLSYHDGDGRGDGQEPRSSNGRRRRQPRVRTMSDLGAMMLSKAQANPTILQAAEDVSSSSFFPSSRGDGCASGRLDGVTDSFVGPTSTTNHTRSSSNVMNTKHTTISTEDMGDIVSPALRLRRMKRRLLLQSVGNSNDHILRSSGSSCGTPGGGTTNVPAMINRTDSDLSESSSLSVVSDGGDDSS
jgi:hypothetical protein